MAVNKQKKGNMYGFINSTWNPMRGVCLHRCKYCYAKKVQYLSGTFHLEEKCFKDKLGEHQSIFVGSSTDMWGEWVFDSHIKQVLDHCKKFDSNRYLFQTKNPGRWIDYRKDDFPRITILATTIESNRDYPNISQAPKILYRIMAVQGISKIFSFPLMVTIEPILDFDIDELVDMLRLIGPCQVNIGADSKGHSLPEPSADKVIELIAKLEMFTRVYRKDNLDRILKKAK